MTILERINLVEIGEAIYFNPDEWEEDKEGCIKEALGEIMLGFIDAGFVRLIIHEAGEYIPTSHSLLDKSSVGIRMTCLPYKNETEDT